ncbi:MAG: T9SS type A sorting domain-containing protein [Bacteroidota bacterium]
MKRLLLLIAAIVCFILETNAQIIHIPAGQPTIQEGINAASAGDTVLVAEGTYFENINFRGKPITLASQFILDGDTAHISRTVIDGSQPANPDTASVVIMWSGEDTTSVLMGFTITGGKGTLVNIPVNDNSKLLSAGGILIKGSGGKIIDNVIEENHTVTPPATWGNFGCGVLVDVFNDHTAIIRDNLIRGNTGTNGGGWAGGILLIGGDMIVENNLVTGNTLNLEGISAGGGIVGWFPVERSFNKVIIRNNTITGNKAGSISSNGFGGGVGLMWAPGQEKVQFYNNVVSGNESEGYGGGVYLWANEDLHLVNNTIINNKASMAGQSAFSDGTNRVVFFNNIIWSGSEQKSDFAYSDPKSDLFYANSNLLKKPFGKNDPVVETGSTYMDPFLDPVTYQPTENSPAIGRGTDSVEIDGTWYVAPPMDLAGNSRPNAVDRNVDIGAFESELSRSLLPEASLVTLQVPDLILVPDFQPEILEYEVDVLDIYDAFEDLVFIPVDAFAVTDYNPAADILSESLEEKTSTISVTSTDGTEENVYKILYNAFSTNATLSALYVEPFTLDPVFDPEILEYVVTLPAGTSEAPEVNAVPSDENAEVNIYDATFADDSHRTTTIVVKPEAGRKFKQSFNKTYLIRFEVETGVSAPGGNSGPRIFPNPFSTTFTAEWKSNGIIQRIELVNMLGQTVRTIDHPQGPSVTITRENLPSGIYFLKMHADETLIRKVMIE